MIVMSSTRIEQLAIVRRKADINMVSAPSRTYAVVGVAFISRLATIEPRGIITVTAVRLWRDRAGAARRCQRQVWKKTFAELVKSVHNERDKRRTSVDFLVVGAKHRCDTCEKRSESAGHDDVLLAVVSVTRDPTTDSGSGVKAA